MPVLTVEIRELIECICCHRIFEWHELAEENKCYDCLYINEELPF